MFETQTDRDGLLMETYINTEQALAVGTITEADFPAALIYSLTLLDLDGPADTDAPLRAQIADRDVYRKRVGEVVVEFIDWSQRMTDKAVKEAGVAQSDADEQMGKVRRELLAPELFDRVVAEAERFIVDFNKYTKEEKTLSILLGCHPETIRGMNVKLQGDTLVADAPASSNFDMSKES